MTHEFLLLERAGRLDGDPKDVHVLTLCRGHNNVCTDVHILTPCGGHSNVPKDVHALVPMW